MTMSRADPLTKPGEIQVATDKIIYAVALKDWEIERRSNYQRIESFRNPNSAAIIRMILSLSNDQQDALFRALPKRGRDFLQESDPLFYDSNERQFVRAFLDKFSRFAMPFFPDNESITELWEQHETLQKNFAKSIL